jgi:predicted secreted protein
MRQAHKILVIMEAGSLLLTSCGGAAQSPVNPTPGVAAKVSPAEGTTVMIGAVVTAAREAKSVSVRVGDTLEIQIPSIPTAGFKWEPKDLDTSILTPLGDPVFEADSASAGAGGITTLKFKVVGAGITTLTLIYASASKNGLPSMYKDSFGMTVEAK